VPASPPPPRAHDHPAGAPAGGRDPGQPGRRSSPHAPPPNPSPPTPNPNPYPPAGSRHASTNWDVEYIAKARLSACASTTMDTRSVALWLEGRQLGGPSTGPPQPAAAAGCGAGGERRPSERRPSSHASSSSLHSGLQHVAAGLLAAPADGSSPKAGAALVGSSDSSYTGSILRPPSSHNNSIGPCGNSSAWASVQGPQQQQQQQPSAAADTILQVGESAHLRRAARHVRRRLPLPHSPPPPSPARPPAAPPQVLGHRLSLERTILREVIQDGSGTWITDCTTYLHNMDRPNADMFLSAKARNVMSMVVVAMPPAPHATCPAMGLYLTSSTPLTVLLLQVGAACGAATAGAAADALAAPGALRRLACPRRRPPPGPCRALSVACWGVGCSAPAVGCSAPAVAAPAADAAEGPPGAGGPAAAAAGAQAGHHHGRGVGLLAAGGARPAGVGKCGPT
jgi:hypothetical protein